MVDLSFMKASNLLKAIGLNPGYDRNSPQGLIQYACELRQPATITVDGHLDKFKSFFLETDDNGGHVYIDEFTPRVDDGLLVPNKTVMRISFDMYGVGRNFRAVYEGKERVGTHNALKLTIPEAIEIIQRREYFRVRPRLADPVNVLFLHKESKWVTGVVDISVGGVSFNSASRISSGVLLPSVIKLPNEYAHFRVQLNTRGIDKLQTPERGEEKIIKPYKVRAQFKRLLIADTNILNKYIMDRQRNTVNTAG